jgi:hypothetical protein
MNAIAPGLGAKESVARSHIQQVYRLDCLQFCSKLLISLRSNSDHHRRFVAAKGTILTRRPVEKEFNIGWITCCALGLYYWMDLANGGCLTA